VLAEMAREMGFLFTIFLYFVEIFHKEYPNERDKNSVIVTWVKV
jgi:hypothetical protein